MLISNCLYSQSANRNNYDVKSPNVSDFIRYGNIPTNMYSGELGLSIPLMSIPVNGQSPIDLSLSYNASGFIPNKRPGIAGLNWNINGIPAITREVKGSPDDHIGNPSYQNGINGRYEHGFMVGMKYLKNANANLPNGIIIGKIFPMRNNTTDLFPEVRFVDAAAGVTNSFETTPDIFHFDVNGFSGKFFMTSDGKIKVISNSPDLITVDLTNFNFQPLIECNPINLSEIKLIDNQGNKYIFGGESKFLEYTLNFNGSIGSNPVINTWYLKRIEYYNNEIVYYNYQNDNISLGSDTYFCSDPTNYFKALNNNDEVKKFFFINESVSDTRKTERINNGEIIPTGGSRHIFTLHKKAFLDNITGTNFKLIFSYSSHGYIFNNNNNINSSFKNFKEFKIDNIILKLGEHEIKKINFAYSLKGGLNQENSYPRLFLNTVQETGKPPYSFDYDILPNQLLPKPSTCAVDFWGFYNGKLTNDAPAFGYDLLIAQSTVDSNGDETYISNIRNSNFNFSKIGSLKKVTYPTGGYSEFEYEPHKYGKRLDRKSVSNFLPLLFDVNGEVGGTRIKKITDFDGVQNTNVKEYIYSNNLNNSISSGILMQWPRSQFKYTHRTEPYGGLCGLVYFGSGLIIVEQAIISSSSINQNVVENSVINYSSVIEKTLTNGYVVNNFKNYINTPDITDFSFHEKSVEPIYYCDDDDVTVHITESFIPENFVKNQKLLYNDRSIERGKLESKYVYNNANTLVLKEEYLYNTDSSRFLQNSQYAAASNAWWYGGKQYYYSDFLTEKKVTEYYNSGSLVTSEKSTYISAPNYDSIIMSNQDVLNKSSTTSSVNDEIIETEYNYPWQNYLATSTEYLNFKNANIMHPIREIQYRNFVKLSEKFTLFAKDASTNSLMLPKSIYGAKFPNLFPNITDIGNLEKTHTYDLYDSKGNILQMTPENGVPLSIIWGYNKSKPIAKIENALYASISTSDITNLQTLSDTGTEANLITALNTLRSSLPNAMITTYTHKPLIGVSTITDSKGDVKNYFYDSNGRLKTVKDKEGNIITENQYHYKN